jgi:acyl carrier protein
MTNDELYKKVFCETFQIEESQLTGLTYQGVKSWDSIGHMALVADLEESFDVMMETDDIINMSSFEKGKEILTKNYAVEF